MNWFVVIAAAGFLLMKTGEKFATQETAGPTVTLLTSYVGEKNGQGFEPHIFNDPAKAIAYCAASKPAVGIVTPGFYFTYAKALGMEPLLEANRQKIETERYVLVVKKSGADDPAAFAGKTIATPLAAEQRFVLAVVLQNKLGDEVRLQSVTDAEGAIFDLAEGAKNAADAVLLEESIWKTIRDDADLGPQVKAVFTSADLPRNLVVLFPDNAGKIDPVKLKDSLKGMATDPAGKGILENIRVESFVDIDDGRLQKARIYFMRISTGMIVACLVAGCGCARIANVRAPTGQRVVLSAAEAQNSWSEAVQLGSRQPRTLERMTKVSALLEVVARSLPNDYDAQWQAAQALAFVAENSTQSAVRVASAKLGITLARHGQELLPNRVECHYWYAIDAGLLADADRSYGLKGVGEMETALRRANELDERYDYGGPSRVLGILHLRTPPPPVSIGSSRKGLKSLQHAMDLFPDYPENWLYLAEALRDNGQTEKARELLQRVVDTPSWPDRQFESGGWKSAAKKLRQSLSGQ